MQDFGATYESLFKIKRLLDGWPRDSLKKVYLTVAQNYDTGLTDKVYRSSLASVMVSHRLPLTARMLERLFDRFSLVRDPTNVDYKKLLVYLDTVFEVADFHPKSKSSEEKSVNPLAFPLPAPDQQQQLDNSELAQVGCFQNPISLFEICFIFLFVDFS